MTWTQTAAHHHDGLNSTRFEDATCDDKVIIFASHPSGKSRSSTSSRRVAPPSLAPHSAQPAVALKRTRNVIRRRPGAIFAGKDINIQRLTRRFSSPTSESFERFGTGPTSFASSHSVSDDESEIGDSPDPAAVDRGGLTLFDLEKIWALPCWSSPESAHRRRSSIASFSTINSTSSRCVVDDIARYYSTSDGETATTHGPGLQTPTSGVASSEGFRFSAGATSDSEGDDTARTSWPSSRAGSLKAGARGVQDVVVASELDQNREQGYPASTLFRPRGDQLENGALLSVAAPARKSSLPIAQVPLQRCSVLWQAELPTAQAFSGSLSHLPLSPSQTLPSANSRTARPSQPAVARPGSWFDRDFLGFGSHKVSSRHGHVTAVDIDVDVADIDPVESHEASPRRPFYGLANKSRTFLASLSQPNLLAKKVQPSHSARSGGLTISHPVGPTYTTSTAAQSAVPIATPTTLAAPIEFVKPKSGPGAAFKRQLARFAGKNSNKMSSAASAAIGEAPARPARARTRPPANAVASGSGSSSPHTSQPSTPVRRLSPGQPAHPPSIDTSGRSMHSLSGESSTTFDPVSQPMTPTTSQRSADVDLASRLAALGVSASPSSPSAAMAVLANAQARASASTSKTSPQSGTYVNARIARERSRERELAERQKRLPVVKDGYKIVDGVEKKVSSSGVYTPATFPGPAGGSRSPSLQQQDQMSSPGSPNSPVLPTPGSDNSYFAVQQRALLRRTSSSAMTATSPIGAVGSSERRKSFIKPRETPTPELAYQSLSSYKAISHQQARSLSASAAFDAFPRAAEGHGLGVGFVDLGDDLPPSPRKARSPSMPLSHLHATEGLQQQQATVNKNIKRKPVPAARDADAA